MLRMSIARVTEARVRDSPVISPAQVGELSLSAHNLIILLVRIVSAVSIDAGKDPSKPEYYSNAANWIVELESPILLYRGE